MGAKRLKEHRKLAFEMIQEVESALDAGGGGLEVHVAQAWDNARGVSLHVGDNSP